MRYRAILMVMLVGLAGACAGPAPALTPTAPPQQLRVVCSVDTMVSPNTG